MAKARKRWWIVCLGADEVYRCLAHSAKEAFDTLEGTLVDQNIDEFCAEHGMTLDDLSAVEGDET